MECYLFCSIGSDDRPAVAHASPDMYDVVFDGTVVGLASRGPGEEH